MAGQEPELKVIASVDVWRLEDHLLERLAARPRGGLLDPVLVLVPTLVLARHLGRRLAERLGAALGVHLFTHRAFARRVLEHALVPPPRPLPDAALAALADVLAAELGGAEGGYLRRFRGARRALLRTLADLREAGVTPAELRAAAAGSPGIPGFLPDLYERYAAALARLAAEGWADEILFARAALPYVPRFLGAKRIRRAYHHGAYELTGASLELWRAVAAATGAELLIPGEAEEPAAAGGGRFLEVLRRGGTAVELRTPLPGGGRAAWSERLRRLLVADPDLAAGGGGKGDGAAPAGAPLLEVRSAQGPEAELRAAALRALALAGGERNPPAEGDIPPSEIVIIARSLEPYLPFLERTFVELGLPFSTSAAEPLLRDPGVAALLKLLHALAGDLDRSAVFDLFRTPAFRAPGAAFSPREVDFLDRVSREARIVSGLAAWRDLPELISRLGWQRGEAEAPAAPAAPARPDADPAPARRLLGILEALEEERRLWDEAATQADHARLLRRLCQTFIVPESHSPCLEDLIEAVEAAGRAREAARAGARRVAPLEVLELLDEAAGLPSLPLAGDDTGGIRILDLMQARGVTARVVIWIGFHHGLFPRRGRADPYLDDAARSALRQAAGRPLPLKAEAAAGEERLLLALALAGARERVVLSYQRADDDGRRRGRSSALRAMAWAFTGVADARALLRGEGANVPPPDEVPVHPARRARHYSESPFFGLLPAPEVVAGAAASAHRGPAAARAAVAALGLGEDRARAAALDWLERVESFRGGDGAFDGTTLRGIEPDRELSPSALEKLARCPQSYFLRYVLGVREIEAETAAHGIERKALGIAVHATLADLYRALEKEGRFARPEEAAAAAARALELLGDLWRRHLERAAGPSFARLRGLFVVLAERWRKALAAFVETDVNEILAAGMRPAGFEEDVKARIPLPRGEDLHLAGRVDRLLRTPGGPRIDDYKTGENLDNLVDKTRMLQGIALQLPLYREIVAAAEGSPPAAVAARLLGIRPDRELEKADLQWDGSIRDGMLETVAVAVELAREGRFPLHPSEGDFGYCKYCGYSRACRRGHEPTLARLRAEPALRDFQTVKEKETRRGHTIAAVRELAARAAAPGEVGAAAEDEEGGSS